MSRTLVLVGSYFWTWHPFFFKSCLLEKYTLYYRPDHIDCGGGVYVCDEVKTSFHVSEVHFIFWVLTLTLFLITIMFGARVKWNLEVFGFKPWTVVLFVLYKLTQFTNCWGALDIWHVSHTVPIKKNPFSDDHVGLRDVSAAKFGQGPFWVFPKIHPNLGAETSC